LPAAERLKKIYEETVFLIKKYKPEIISIESLYFFKNMKTAMPVSQARGVILLAIAQSNTKFVEFTPLQIKSAVVGYGKADKSQMQKMLKIILGLKDMPRPDDASDALGAAVCCAHVNPMWTNLA
jgi:crossover junction endodeoxyribonuclease RuvC